MILIGSRALNEYFPIERKMHDWDFLINAFEYDLFQVQFYNYKVKETNTHVIYDFNGEIAEVRIPKDLDESDVILLNTQIKSPFKDSIETPFGFAQIPDLQTLYDIKKATSEYINEPKHKADLKLIEEKYPNLVKNTLFGGIREEEIKERVQKSKQIKYDFFHKYHIPEYIEHDRLHDMYADLLDLNIATYKRITTAETSISKELFDKLTHEQKINLMTEEALVLNLERWFIPQMIENGINYHLIDHFYNNNEAMPTYQILKHVCITGLKGEADFITNFSRDHFFEIELNWIKMKERIKEKNAFPNWFFNEIFELRKKYLNKEKVGLHHEL